jgi:hypothetical protein
VSRFRSRPDSSSRPTQRSFGGPTKANRPRLLGHWEFDPASREWRPGNAPNAHWSRRRVVDSSNELGDRDRIAARGLRTHSLRRTKSSTSRRATCAPCRIWCQSVNRLRTQSRPGDDGSRCCSHFTIPQQTAQAFVPNVARPKATGSAATALAGLSTAGR